MEISLAGPTTYVVGLKAEHPVESRDGLTLQSIEIKLQSCTLVLIVIAKDLLIPSACSGEVDQAVYYLLQSQSNPEFNCTATAKLKLIKTMVQLKLLKLLSMLPCLRKPETDDRESPYYKNLSKLLEHLIAFCDGESESHPIHCYSAAELIRATNNFHPSCIITEAAWFKMFRGVQGDRSIIIKKYSIGSQFNEDKVRSMAIHDIVISLQMGNHENVLKLLGCCLEFPMPALVHEDASIGILNSNGKGTNGDDLPWTARLNIAKQIASAVAHLHTALPRPTVLWDLNPSCIFLDHDHVPKLYNFSRSLTLPPGECYVEVIELAGTIGYIDPTCFSCMRISAKSDVYSFGVVLLVFLTGKSVCEVPDQERDYGSIVDYVKSHRYQLQRIVDPQMFEEVEGNDQVVQQLHDFVALALSCIQEESQGRPHMSDVVRELDRILIL